MYQPGGYYPNPMMQTAQQRLQMLEAQYPQFSGTPGMGYPQTGAYAGQAPQSNPAAPILKGRPVSNEEEANAAMIDFDGSLFVFPDKAHGKIYTKQLGLDGNIIFNVYTQEGAVPAAPQPATYQTPDMTGYLKKEDMEPVLKGIDERIAKIEQRFNAGNKGGNK